MKRAGMLLFVLMVVAVFVAGCGEKDDSSIRVGVIAELTGDMPAVGESCKNAAEMAVKEINDAGGLEVGERNTRSSSSSRTTRAKPTSPPPRPRSSSPSRTCLPSSAPMRPATPFPPPRSPRAPRSLLITPWSTNPKTTLDAKTGAPKKYVFRACFIDPFQGRVVAKFALENLKAKKAAVLYDVASDYNKGIAEVFKETFEETEARWSPSRPIPRTTRIFRPS